MLIVKSLRFAVFLRGYRWLDWVVAPFLLCGCWVTLTFDSSPIKGEGDGGWCCLVHPRHPVDTGLKPV